MRFHLSILPTDTDQAGFLWLDGVRLAAHCGGAGHNQMLPEESVNVATSLAASPVGHQGNKKCPTRNVSVKRARRSRGRVGGTSSKRKEGLRAILALLLRQPHQLPHVCHAAALHQHAPPKPQRAPLAHSAHLRVCTQRRGRRRYVDAGSANSGAGGRRGCCSSVRQAAHWHHISGAPTQLATPAAAPACLPGMPSMSATWAMPTRRRTMTAPRKPTASRHSSAMKACCACCSAAAPCQASNRGRRVKGGGAAYR